MKRNRGYHRYRGFRLTPRELRYGMGLTRHGLRCTRVRVRCGKTRPAVYPCATLKCSGTTMQSGVSTPWAQKKSVFSPQFFFITLGFTSSKRPSQNSIRWLAMSIVMLSTIGLLLLLVPFQKDFSLQFVHWWISDILTRHQWSTMMIVTILRMHYGSFMSIRMLSSRPEHVSEHTTTLCWQSVDSKGRDATKCCSQYLW